MRTNENNRSAPQPGSWAHLDSADDRWRRQCGAAGAVRDALLTGIVRQFRRDPGLALLRHQFARATDGPVASWMLAGTMLLSHNFTATLLSTSPS